MNDAPPETTGSENAPTAPGRSEDWFAIWLGAFFLALAAGSVLITATEDADGPVYGSPLAEWTAKPAKWVANPLDSLWANESPPLLGVAGAGILLLVVYAAACPLMGRRPGPFAAGFVPVFLLAVLAQVLAAQVVVKQYNLEYALWALLLGLVISNTVGTPALLKPAVCTEFFIKTGLVILGAEVLLSRLMAFGAPGIFVAWIVTPIVLITTFIFGQRVLKIPSPSLNMVISADMSVCGVSAAIATAAACRAKKEELSFAIGLSLSFTVLMMIVEPAVIKAVGMDEIVAGAWMGGTIDSTGAVAAAGALVGDNALQVAATVKMIQNILIGVVAFGVAVYWVSRVERDPNAPRPGAGEIWRRFPKFVLGFVGVSLLFSALYALHADGEALVDATTDVSKNFRGWLFCLAFVCIGLETDFRQLAPFFKGGKPLILYVAGQSLNLILTLFMAWLMFGTLFRDRIEALLK